MHNFELSWSNITQNVLRHRAITLPRASWCNRLNGSAPHQLKMVLKRSESARSTLSTLQRRATRYQKYLTLASVVLIITSIIVIFSSVILIKFYHLTKLHFWNPYFYVTPILLISLGVYKFIVAVYGFAITGTENRGKQCAFYFSLVL